MPALLAVVLSGAVAAGAGLWLDVPFVRQQANGCGAACISMVMQYWLRGKDSAIPAAAQALRESAQAVAAAFARSLTPPATPG